MMYIRRDVNEEMQFHKLLYFSHLINGELQLQQHQQQEQRRKFYCHYQRHHISQWNILAFLAMLITFTAANADATATGTATLAKQSLPENYAYPQRVANFDDLVEISTIQSARTTTDQHQHQRNSTDDFERELLAQLKREQELHVRSDGSKLEGDYDTETTDNTATTATLGTTQRKTLLSRKRRYLLFPEGSSFQVVYDGIVGIVDYTNYLILGITVALAWELPAKAPSEMLEDIKMQLDEGTLLLQRNDTAQNITYIDTKPKKTTPSYNNLVDGRSQYGQKQQFYSNNRQMNKDLLQPVFIPPMHGNYYHRPSRPSEWPPSTSRNSYYHRTKPTTSTKYAYYFQPKGQYTGARNDMTPSYFGKERSDDWRRKDNNYYYEAISRKPIPEGSYGSRMYSGNSHRSSSSSRSNNSKYPWWNLTSRLTNSLRGGGIAPKIHTARQFNNNNNFNDDADADTRMLRANRKQQQTSSSGYYQSKPSTLASARTSTKSTSKSSSSSSSSSTSSSTAAVQHKHRIYPVFGKRSIPDTATSPQQQQQHEQHEQQWQEQEWNETPASKPHDLPQQEEHQNHQQNVHWHHAQHQPCQRCRRRRLAGIDNDEQLSKFDRIHIRHHRRTRHTLYEKIEKYLDKRGSHGHHCVLRALCETGQKANEIEPGSFLGELMRAVFTIPEPIEEDEDHHRIEYIEHRYDAAHAYTGDCGQRYFRCKNSLWESHFIM